ncbi:MATE family efflux transporter [Paracoccus aminophilus]|uniref:Multidrug-efflux transporter n=1 Tax=Paracoccus aminophilus JCM 7686 TaxID=1367847 RepID=S5XK70_PARAH|nr:MATE family efflux transporter [Paracoccus aminophilus]AGT07564.1 MATE efflux family protein [Paracoccus aminophilus JCM 7686]
MSFKNLAPHLTATLGLALPLIGSHLARQAIGVTDTVMVGWYGVDPLAAVVLATSSFFILYMLGSGYGIGVMGVIATALARGDRTEVRRATRMALWLSTVHAVLVLPLMWWSGAILLALGQRPEVAAYGQEYLRVMCWAMAPTLWGLTLNSFLAALGRPNMVLLVTVAGIPVNMALNYALIFGHYGMPELGVAGSALASLITNIGQMGLLIYFATTLPEARPFQLFRRFWNPDPETLRAVFLLGLPIGLTMVAEVGMFTGTNVMMGWFGSDVLAAHGIALQLGSIAFMIPLGLSNAVTIRVGGFYGEGARSEIRRAGYAGILLSIFFSLVTITIFLTLSRQIAALYLDASDPRTPAIIALVAGLIIYAAAFQLADGMQVIALGMLRGVQDTRIPMVLAIVSYWLIGLPSGWFLSMRAGFGPPGLWLGLLAGLSCAAVLLMVRFWRGFARGWTPGAVAR